MVKGAPDCEYTQVRAPRDYPDDTIDLCASDILPATSLGLLAVSDNTLIFTVQHQARRPWNPHKATSIGRPIEPYRNVFEQGRETLPALRTQQSSTCLLLL